jgi:hypothetical protein
MWHVPGEIHLRGAWKYGTCLQFKDEKKKEKKSANGITASYGVQL